jgi:hypothetical protein
MLVKELIQELQKCNPEQEMVFHCDIESGRSFSSCKEGDYGIEVEELDEDEIREQLIKEMGYSDEEDLDEDEIGDLNKWVKEYEPKVVFSISGEETDYE